MIHLNNNVHIPVKKFLDQRIYITFFLLYFFELHHYLNYFQMQIQEVQQYLIPLIIGRLSKLNNYKILLI